MMALLVIAAPGTGAAGLQVLSTSPARHTFAPATTTIAVTFDQPVMRSSITSSSFRVFGKATFSAPFRKQDATIFKDTSD